MTKPSTTDFENELREIFAFAEGKNLLSITVKAGNLHSLLGHYPGPNHRMPVCCKVMRAAMQRNDKVVAEPPKGAGANLDIQYFFPRQKF